MATEGPDSQTTQSPDSRKVAGAASGLSVHWEGLRLLRSERSLWKLAAIPFVIALATCGIAFTLIVVYAGGLHDLATAWMPVLDAGSWYTWLWIGPAKVFFGVLGAALFLALAGVGLVVAFLVASVISSPFHDALSRRVEAIIQGRVDEIQDPGIMGAIREGGRAMSEELRRLFFFLAIQISIAFLGFVIPGGQLVAPAILVGVTVLFLPLDYASYTLDRRRVPFRDKRRWIVRHRLAMVGFGAGAFLTLMVPGLNFLAMPGLVVSGTLLALRYPPAPSA